MTQAQTTGPERNRVVALCGGVGGAKLALGLSRQLGEALTIVVNTGDDFEHLGLQISPDLDTVLYTLSGLANRELGWGRADESWNFMEVLADLGSETWFRLGDRDLALHVERTRRLKAGETLTHIMRSVAGRFGIDPRILPMTDDPVRTTVTTTEGDLPFQRYFVEQRCAPVATEIRFDGCREARLTRDVSAALQDPNLQAIIVCPSNPFLSIDPILSVGGIRRLVATAGVPVVAVSPIIGGKAVKGPTDKIMSELGVPVTSAAIVRHYDGLLDGMLIDAEDAAEAEEIAIPTRAVPTLMKNDGDKDRLAGAVLDFCVALARAGEAGADA